MVEIAVAVIARPMSPTLEECLDALERAGAEQSVVAVGADGAGMARNRALAGCPADVLALVEDDVVVEVQWLGALRDAWTAAADDVAVVAGPLRARFTGGRPAWLGPGLDGAFAALDLGADAMDVDLEQRSFHGGNVSFCVAALRGAAGFWPARGHRDGRDWFSDEHHAQHALARCGWRGRYQPEVAASRVVAPDQTDLQVLLRRRVHYGARLAAVGGGRPIATAARSLATGLAGAAILGEGRARQTRLLRAAENAGVLLGPRLARGDFEPVARSTPFRSSVPLPARRRRVRAPRGAVVLLYHRIAETTPDPLRLGVSPRRFAEHLDVLASDHRVVSLDQLAREREPGTIAITFDDGYADNATVAAPLLASAGLPWTLFVSTGHVDERRTFWWDDVIELLGRPSAGAAPELAIPMPGGLRSWRVERDAHRAAARDLLLAALQGLDSGAIDNAVGALGDWAGRRPAGEPAMSVATVRRLARSGVAIGAHTRTHRALAHATPDEQREEVARSRDDLTAWLASSPTAFSYPFGVPGADLDATSARVAREEGFTTAVINARGAVRHDTDAMALPRWAARDVPAADFAAGLRSLLGRSSSTGTPELSARFLSQVALCSTRCP
jgi:peptidoglycan/xylan/chitin deacetylase (PgdA/CDA1 family)